MQSPLSMTVSPVGPCPPSVQHQEGQEEGSNLPEHHEAPQPAAVGQVSSQPHISQEPQRSTQEGAHRASLACVGACSCCARTTHSNHKRMPDQTIKAIESVVRQFVEISCNNGLSCNVEDNDVQSQGSAFYPVNLSAEDQHNFRVMCRYLNIDFNKICNPQYSALPCAHPPGYEQAEFHTAYQALRQRFNSVAQSTR